VLLFNKTTKETEYFKKEKFVVESTRHLLLLLVTIRFCLYKLGLISSESSVW